MNPDKLVFATALLAGVAVYGPVWLQAIVLSFAIMGAVAWGLMAWCKHEQAWRKEK